jgi:hypothetical protein
MKKHKLIREYLFATTIDRAELMVSDHIDRVLMNSLWSKIQSTVSENFIKVEFYAES